jgi:hypothetical protein
VFNIGILGVVAIVVSAAVVVAAIANELKNSNLRQQ